MCTDLAADPLQIVRWCVQRWQVEVTFEQVRTHLGVETQRQCNPQAILRTTPALMGLFSLVTVLAHRSRRDKPAPIRQAAWYVKEYATFADALACVRHPLGRFSLELSGHTPDSPKPQALFWDRCLEWLCYAA